jgi:serine phosphatase RsbU (regulator of sigma subunit)
MEMFETDRLVQAVKEGAAGPCSTLIERIQKDLVSFTGKATQADDLLMLAAKVKE